MKSAVTSQAEAVPSQDKSDLATRPRIGIIAGWGRYPIVIVDALKRQGYDVYGLGVSGHADPALAEHCVDFDWTGFGRFGSMVRYFRRRGVHDIMMAGKIHKRQIFQPGFIWRTIPGPTTIRLFAPHFLTRRKDNKDDSLLLTIINFFASRGIRFAPPTDYLPELLVKSENLTKRTPSAAQWKDIRFGWEIAREMGRLDIGQSVAVKNQAVLAVEAIEGTDENISRAGSLCTSGGFSVVKVGKPNQDMRFDVPTVGLGTIETLSESGGKVLAVEAEKTVFVDREATIAYANKKGLVLVAIQEDELAEK